MNIQGFSLELIRYKKWLAICFAVGAILGGLKGFLAAIA